MPAPFPATATLKFDPRTKWVNWHQTVDQAISGIYQPRYPPTNPQTTPAILSACAKDVQQAIGIAKARGLRLRAVGSGWSLSRAPVTDGLILDTSFLKGRIKIKEPDVEPAYSADPDARGSLFLFQCGNLVAEVNKTVESDAFKRSLRTSGAANGQTIVGATSTGTHGSALTQGALHDQIVAIHLITSDQQQIWLERLSRPVMKASFVAQFGIPAPTRDDALFNAVVMSFGSMGVIHAVVIETGPRMLLRAEKVMPVPYDDSLKALLNSLDFAKYDPLKAKGVPYFFQTVINPNTSEAMIDVHYEIPWDPAHVLDYELKETKVGPGYDALSLVGKIFESGKFLIPPFLKLLQGTIDKTPKIGTRGELFGYKAPQTKVASATVAVALPDASRALDALLQLNKDIGPVPLLFGCRYVKKSRALLAFNKFDTTMVVSLDGVANAQSEKFFDMAAQRMEAAHIPYTQHWGKANSYTKARLDAAYGPANVGAWIAARHALLTAADRGTFTNDYMTKRGLDA
jgi:hypothetical protein